jgi:hypothetical protein
VKLLHAAKTAKPFGPADEAIFMAREDTGKRLAGIKGHGSKQWGSIMWDIIISLIYRHSCRKYLAAARKQSSLNHLWS